MIENFVTREEELEFIEANRKEDNEEERGGDLERRNEAEEKSRGWKSLSKRRVRHYGKKFDYDTRDAANDAEEKIPELLDVDVRERLRALISLSAADDNENASEGANKRENESAKSDFLFTRQNANDDAWTEEGILEYYWGEHIHLGYYTDEDMAKGAGTLIGCNVKDFIEAKFDFVDKMLEWSECPPEPARVLDVGCGIGGTSRHLAKSLGPKSQVQGITLSPNQRDRATALAKEQGVDNASFQVMNALAMDFEDDTFDLVWACESGEHMPDKKKYVEEMVRVLKPGGRLVIATWCQRSTPPAFTEEDLVNLDYLYKEWAHPYFISIEEYASLVEGTTTMRDVDTDDWTRQTIASWRHSIWAGVWDPIPVFSRPNIWYKTLRDIVCLERMRRAFGRGLMQYGMIKGVKVKASR